MFNTLLLGFFVMFLGITSAEQTPSKLQYVLGLNNTRAGNTLETVTPSNGSHSAEGVRIIGGSFVDQANNTYLSLQRVKDAKIFLPPAYSSENGIPKSLSELMTGPRTRSNIMNPDRRLVVQGNLNSLKESSHDFKEKLYGLMRKGKNIQGLAGILQSTISAELRLQDQQTLLDDFNIAIPWSPPKIDYFDRDLKTISLNIEELIAASLPFALFIV